MMLVRTKIGPSDIHGTGVFAAEDIHKSTPVWGFTDNFDLTFSQEQLDALPTPAREQMLNYAYLDPKKKLYVLCADNARFFNHSSTPNVIAKNNDPASIEDVDVAARDIKSGEELTYNYEGMDMNFETYKSKLK